LTTLAHFTVKVEPFLQCGDALLKTQEFKAAPVPFWLICFSDTVKGPLRQLFFVVLLPDGTVVVPKVAERLQSMARCGAI